MLLVAERNDAYAFGLRLAGEVRDGNAGHTENRVEPVEFQGIDYQMKPVGLFRRLNVACHDKIPLSSV